jgi:hypothetical protein
VAQHVIIFQQDRATPHYSLIVGKALNNRFPGGWIGMNCSVLWPPRSPDITPMNFWGYLKNIVYVVKIRDMHHLKERINAAITTVTPDMIQRT